MVQNSEPDKWFKELGLPRWGLLRGLGEAPETMMEVSWYSGGGCGVGT